MIPLEMPTATRRAFEIVLWRCAHGCGNYRRICLAEYPARARDSHKGTFGSVLAVAGSAFYRGAALLAAEGALRTGAGIVTLASVEPVVSAAVTRLPECCLWPL